MTQTQSNTLSRKLTPKQIARIMDDPVKTAKAVKLIHVSDSDEGIIRVKRGRGFSYLYKNKKMTDKVQLNRIKELVIPPAWKNVWICTLENGHLQVTGYDIKKRKQYIYHPVWIALRNQTNFIE